MYILLIKKDSTYLIYITSLNYWDTNWFFVILVFCLLTKLSSLVFLSNFLIFSSNYLKFSIFRQLFVKKTIVVSLFAGTITIHPLLFYFSTISFLIVVLYKKQTNQLTFFPVTIYRLSQALFLALILGGFWGLQSLSWGYVWVNDLVEWSLFLLLSLSLLLIHRFNRDFIGFFHLLLIIWILNIILAIRLNFFSTRHSFLTNTNYLYAIYSVYYFLIFFLSSLYIKRSLVNSRLEVTLSIWIGVIYLFKKIAITFILKFFFFYGFVVLLLQNLLYKFSFYRWLHFFISLFTLVWAAFYSFFHLNYSHLEYCDFGELLLFFKASSIQADFYTFLNKFNLIEFINFYDGLPSFTSNVVLWQLYHQAIFNNFYIFLFVGFVFFVKLVEFGLLYQKKTYF